MQALRPQYLELKRKPNKFKLDQFFEIVVSEIESLKNKVMNLEAELKNRQVIS